MRQSAEPPRRVVLQRAAGKLPSRRKAQAARREALRLSLVARHERRRAKVEAGSIRETHQEAAQ